MGANVELVDKEGVWYVSTLEKMGHEGYLLIIFFGNAGKPIKF
jgi:hypothetical protein